MDGVAFSVRIHKNIKYKKSLKKCHLQVLIIGQSKEEKWRVRVTLEGMKKMQIFNFKGKKISQKQARVR
jgi:hypothetical protein